VRCCFLCRAPDAGSDKVQRVRPIDTIKIWSFSTEGEGAALFQMEDLPPDTSLRIVRSTSRLLQFGAVIVDHGDGAPDLDAEVAMHVDEGRFREAARR
jgi:hypothetical protein